MTTTKIILHNLPRVCYAWDFIAKQKTQRTEEGLSITIPYQARQNGSKWLSRWEEQYAFDTTEFDMVVMIFDTPPSTQVFEVKQYFELNQPIRDKACEKVRLVLWQHEGKYIDNGLTILNAQDIGMITGLSGGTFDHISPPLDALSFSTYFSVIFGSVSYEQDQRRQRNVTVSIPKGIQVPDNMMSLVYTSSMVDSVTIGCSSGTIKFRVQEGEGKWQITFICKYSLQLPDGIHINPHTSTDVLYVQMLGQIVRTTDDVFDPALIYEMARMSKATFTSILASHKDLNDIYMNCIARGNIMWASAIQARQLETYIPQNPPTLAPMRTHSCMPPPLPHYPPHQ